MRHRLVLAMTLALALLLASCSKVPTRTVRPASSSAGAAGPATNSVRILAAAQDDPELTALIRAYYAKDPAARVIKVPVLPGKDPVAAAKAALEDGSVDLVYTGLLGGAIADLAQEGLLEPLEPYIKKSRLDLAPYGSLPDLMRMDGRLYDLAYALRPWVLVYNQQMFRDEGLSQPVEGWTWDQLREAARRLTHGAGAAKVWGLYTASPDLLGHALLAEGTGGREAGEQELREALSLLQTMAFTDRSLAPAGSATALGNGLGFFRQQAAISLEWLPHVRSFAQVGRYAGPGAGKFTWDVAPLPTLPNVRAATYTSVESYAVAAKSPHRDAAWQFLQFAAGPEGAMAVASEGFLPAYRSEQVKRAWLDRQPAPPSGTESLFTTAWRIPARSPEGQAMEKAQSTLFRNALSGDGKADSALSTYLQEAARIKAGAGR